MIAAASGNGVLVESLSNFDDSSAAAPVTAAGSVPSSPSSMLVPFPPMSVAAASCESEGKVSLASAASSYLAHVSGDRW